ncbi:MAG TPA: hypothetical protein VMJ10_33310 [Kofleriaceae bacterium]|nr:hypothetical protein [Kofleriaceae bacterium]
MASASERKCIYCGHPLKVPTRPAHVFPNGLGGRLDSIDTVCDGADGSEDCNNSFSNIEGQVCRRLEAMGAFRGARRGDRKNIKTEVEHQASMWHVEGARMDEKAKRRRDGGLVQPLPSRRADQIATIGDHLHDLHLPPEAMLDGRYKLGAEPDVPPVSAEMERVDGHLKWGDRISKRVMMKIAIELLAHHDHEAARSAELARARRFARYDLGNDMDFHAAPDSETTGSGLPRVKAVWLHGIDVWTSERKLNYRLTLFTEIHWVGTLTEGWTGSRFSASYTFDITDPKKRLVERATRDGAVLVRKSHRVGERDFLDAMDRAEQTNFATSERRTGRAPKPDLDDLYPDVKVFMEKRGWIKKP